MRSLFISSILVMLGFIGNAQTGGVREQADLMGRALLNKDYKTFVTYSYPAIVDQMGGPEKMAASIARQMESMAATAEIQSISYGTPGAAIQEGKELQCTVPQEMVLKTQQGRILARSTLIAISKDGGKRWHFVDAGGRDISAVRESMPNVSRKLVLPAEEAPRFLGN